MNATDMAYNRSIIQILEQGTKRTDRTGTGTISLFGLANKYKVSLDAFPLLTTKKVQWRSMVRELCWLVAGCTNINQQDLTKYTKIWDAWADESGNLGPIYGKQWRAWETNRIYSAYEGTTSFLDIDQLKNAVEMIKTSPDSRRNIVSAWNVGEIEFMKLPPCHMMFQFYVTEGKLDMAMYQRSADMALGVPFNIASYCLLLALVAKQTKLEPGVFTHFIGDAHIYLNHVEKIKEQIERKPLELPKLVIAEEADLFDLKFEHINFENYNHHPAISFEVSV